jgi:hypothetical protein
MSTQLEAIERAIRHGRSPLTVTAMAEALGLRPRTVANALARRGWAFRRAPGGSMVVRDPQGIATGRRLHNPPWANQAGGGRAWVGPPELEAAIARDHAWLRARDARIRQLIAEAA